MILDTAVGCVVAAFCPPRSSPSLPLLCPFFFCFLNMGGKGYTMPQKPYSATDALKRLVDKAECLSLREYLTKSEKNSLGAALMVLLPQ